MKKAERSFSLETQCSLILQRRKMSPNGYRNILLKTPTTASNSKTKTQPTNFPINTQNFGKRKPDFSSVKPRINTNNPRKRISKEETERMLEEWRIKRGKGQEQWKLRRKKKRVVSSKYHTKKKVRNYGLFCLIGEGVKVFFSSIHCFWIFHFRLKSWGPVINDYPFFEDG